MYWLIFAIFCLLISFVTEKIKGYSKKWYMVFLAFVMSLMTGLSGQVSIDHENYVNIYYEATNFSYFSGFNIIQLLLGGGFVEPGYALINIICNLLGFGIVGFFVTVAFLTNLLAVFAIFKFPRPTLGILLFIVSTHFYYETNLVRQMIAVTGFMYCFSFLYEKRYRIYIISVIILVSFHSSALLLLSLLVFKYLLIEKIEYIFKYGVFLIWVLSLYVVLTGSQLGVVSDIMNIVFGDTVYGRYTSGTKQLNAGYGIAYIYNLFTSISFFLYSFNKDWNKDKFLYVILFQLGCIIVNMASSIETMTRFALYFSCFQFMVLPYMTISHSLSNKRSSKTIAKVINYFLIFYYVIYILGYTFVVRGDSLLGKEMYSITNFFN